MATLTSTKIKNTYDALLKSIDNDAIGTTAKQITDGLGNITPLYVSTTQIGIGVTPETGLNLHVFGDAKIGSNLTVIGNLVVEGSTTTVGTDTLTVKDPLIVLANNNTSTDAVDIGFYGKYTPSATTLYSGLFREALTGKYRLFKDLQVEPTTTVNTSGTGYAQADLILGDLDAQNVDVTTTLTTSQFLASHYITLTTAGSDTVINGIRHQHSNKYFNFQLGASGGLKSFIYDGINSSINWLSVDTSGNATFSGNIILSGTVDGRDVATDGAKLDGIEAGADVTDAINVLAAGAVMTTGNQSISGVKTFSDQVTIPATPSASTDAASKGYVDSAIGDNNELSEVLANGNTTGGTDIAVSAGDDITFADDSKAIFGTDGDLEIYHYSITDQAQITINGELDIRANTLSLKSYVGETMLRASSNGTVRLYYDGVEKLQTTSYGVNVTGAINADDYISIEGATNPYLRIQDTTNEEYLNLYSSDNESAIVYTQDTFKISSGIDFLNQTPRLTIDSSGNVGIGTDLPTQSKLVVIDSADASKQIVFSDNATYYGSISHNAGTGLNEYRTEATGGHAFYKGTEATPKVIIDSSGNSTFSGNLGVAGKTPAYGLNLAQGTGSGNKIAWTDGTPDFAASIYASSSTDKLTFATKNSSNVETTALEIDTSQNATFAGDVKVTGSNSYLIRDDGSFIKEDQGLQIGNTSGTGATRPIRFFTESTERMRITSGGDVQLVGNKYLYANPSAGSTTIGAGFQLDAVNNIMKLWTNNTERMRVHANGRVSMGSDTTIAASNNLTLTNASSAEIDINCTGGHNYRLESNSSDDFVITDKTVGTERMRIDSSGNVGINQTNPTSGKLEVQQTATTAALWVQTGGTTSSYTIADFRTGTNLSALSIKGDGDSIFNGNVGIGTDSPDKKVEISGAGGSAILRLTSTDNVVSTGESLGSIEWQSNDGSTPGGTGTQGIINVVDDNSYGNAYSMTFTTANGGTLTERMRIDSSGRVGIGTGTATLDEIFEIKAGNGAGGDPATNAPVMKITNNTTSSDWDVGDKIGGIEYWTRDPSGNAPYITSFINSVNETGNGTLPDGALVFGTATYNAVGGAVERMRIDSSGNVTVGSNSAATSELLQVQAFSHNQAFSGKSSTTNYLWFLRNENNSGRFQLYNSSSTHTIEMTGANGNITIAGTLTEGSDVRIKENIKPLKSQLEIVNKLNPVSYNKIGFKENEIGFVAQEVEEILPELVSEDKEGMKSIAYSKMNTILVKAIQELKAEVELLKTQINN